MAGKRIANAGKTARRQISVGRASVAGRASPYQSGTASKGVALEKPISTIVVAGAIPGKTARIRVLRLPHSQGLPLPAYHTEGSAGMDLIAAIPSAAPIRLKRFQRALIPTGLIFELPRNTEAQVRPRSGLALKQGVTVLNAPGTIDNDYRGEVQVLLINFGAETVSIQRGDRIAQLVVQAVIRCALTESITARATVRGSGGFGSTGKRATGVKSHGTKAKAPKRPRSISAKKSNKSNKKRRSKKINPES
jgi:dUTP pyrophosphatase